MSEQANNKGTMILTHFPPAYPRLGTLPYVMTVLAYLLGMGILTGLNRLYWGMALLCVCILMNYRNLRSRLPFDRVKNPSLRALCSFVFIFIFALVGVILNQMLSIALLVILIPLGNDVLSIYYNLKIDQMKGMKQTLAMVVVILMEIIIIMGIARIFL